MILQLAPQIPVETPRGNGRAILVIDYSEEEDLIWTVIIDETREVWCFRNRHIKAQPNLTFERS